MPANDARRPATPEEVTAQHSTVRRRLRQGLRVVIDLDQTAIGANGRTYERTARGHLKKQGDRGYQATAAFAGDTAILTNLSEAELPTFALEPFYETRQTIEGWLSEATAALQLKGLWARAFAGLEAFLLHTALASNLLNWWERRVLLPASGLPHLGLRQLIDRVITLPARILRLADGHLTLLLPPAHPYARRLAPPGPTWQLPLPFLDLALSDAHF